MPGFAGFSREGLNFLRQLKRNNNREWFLERKQIFEDRVRGPMIELVHSLNAVLAGSSPDHVTEPKRAIYRIYRDTRFSKDKTPYKTHIAAMFPHRALGKHASAGLYVGVSPQEIHVGAGVYMPGPDEITILRRLFAEHHEEVARITGSKAFAKLFGEWHGEQLARMPKGFPPGHPAENLLRRKAWYFIVTLDPDIASGPKLHADVAKRFLAAAPLLKMLNEPLLDRRKKELAREMY